MKTVLLIVPFIMAVAFVAYAEGSINSFTAWNALPIVVGLGVLLAARCSSRAIATGCSVFAISATLLVVLFHLAWFFDWGGTATGSSTSMLAFIFVPLWTYVFSSFAGLLAWGMVRIARKNRASR